MSAVFAALFVILITANVFAKEQALRLLTVDDSLPQMSVRDITKDHRGACRNSIFINFAAGQICNRLNSPHLNQPDTA
ncbi:MAG TPA: hypothetical protein DGF36_01660 [Alteromonas sp.]|nr:hypothetical protein [Alteromonas sp.]